MGISFAAFYLLVIASSGAIVSCLDEVELVTASIAAAMFQVAAVEVVSEE